MPRKIEPDPNRWRDVLDSALEHASHAWVVLEKEADVQRTNPDMWPPSVSNDVGTAAYHFAAMTTYVYEVYQSIYDVHPEPEDDAILTTNQADP